MGGAWGESVESETKEVCQGLPTHRALTFSGSFSSHEAIVLALVKTSESSAGITAPWLTTSIFGKWPSLS